VTVFGNSGDGSRRNGSGQEGIRRNFNSAKKYAAQLRRKIQSA